MNISIKRVDHFGIVAGIIKDLGIVDLINQQIGTDNQEILTTGDVVAGLIINGLGFASRPLMLTPQFFESKALDILIKPGITPEHFNRHRLGRALDVLSEYGCEKLFNYVAVSACAKEGVLTRFGHADTTSYSLDGEYNTNEYDENGQPIEQKITITYGYSKAQRPDLKQVVQELVTSSDGGIPFITKTHSGNASDTKILQERARALMQEFDRSGSRCLVADSKLYTKETAQILNEMNFITRVPATVKAENASITKALEQPSSWIEESKGYKYQEFPVDLFALQDQRWIVFHSQEAHKRAQAALIKEVEREKIHAEKELRALEKRGFGCQEDAQKAAAELSKKWRYHKPLKGESSASKSYATKGRPLPNAPYETTYYLTWSLEYDQKSYKKAVDQRSCFVLATNMPSESLSASEALKAYKGQDHTEKGFAFLKKPEFFTASLNVEKPGRIEAILMIMVLSLMVYSLAQRRLRKNVLQANLLIPNQLNKPIQNPTMRWIFQLFEGVNYVNLETDSLQKTFIEGMNTVRGLIVNHLGANVLRIYHTSQDQGCSM